MLIFVSFRLGVPLWGSALIHQSPMLEQEPNKCARIITEIPQSL